MQKFGYKQKYKSKYEEIKLLIDKLIICEKTSNYQIIYDNLIKKNDKTVKSYKGNTFYHFLSMFTCEKSSEYVKFLKSYSLKINLRNDDGDTPLHLAIKNNNEKMIKCLIDCGSNVLKKNFDKLNSIQLSVKIDISTTYMIIEQIINLEKTSLKPSMLFLRDCKRYQESTKSETLSLNTKDKRINHSLENGNPYFLIKEIKKGCDVNKKLKDDSTYLHIATENYQLEIVQLLIELGSNVNVINSQGETALFIASDKGYYIIVKYLISRGFDVNKKNKLGVSPIHAAILNENYPIVKLLYINGAKL